MREGYLILPRALFQQSAFAKLCRYVCLLQKKTMTSIIVTSIHFSCVYPAPTQVGMHTHTHDTQMWGGTFAITELS